MIFRSSLLGSISRAGLFNQASRTTGFGSCRNLHALSRCSQKVHAFPGSVKNSKTETPLESSTLGNLGLNFGVLGIAKNVSFPYAFCCRSCIHSGPQDEVETRTQRSTNYLEGLPLESGGNGLGRFPLYQSRAVEVETRTQRSTNYLEGLPLESGGNGFGRFPLYQSRAVEVETRTKRSTNYLEGLPLESGGNGFGRFPPYQSRAVEANADIVHIKLMRNNAFVTLTDSKGNKKLGISAGKLAGKGGKLTRYSGEAAAEDIGQKVRQMKIKSVVVKVNGSTFFRKKKQAILSFKDGYSHSRADSNPVVYVEDTTRKPHNGCRRKKKRRI